MKGPFERLKYDLRRLWECPACKRRERTDGSVTARFCNCQAKGESGRPRSMTLLEESGHRTVPPIVPVISAEESVPLAVAETQPQTPPAEPPGP